MGGGKGGGKGGREVERGGGKWKGERMRVSVSITAKIKHTAYVQVSDLRAHTYQ